MNEEEYGNLINILALLIGIENLSENRQQTAYNDVNASNQKQADFLLKKIDEKFNQQNVILTEILEKLKRIEKMTKNKFMGEW